MTAHYRIYNDLRDDQDVLNVAAIMEGAYVEYQNILPAAPDNSLPMRCFVFSRRDEWAAFTSRNAGQDAAVYLKINRGGYTIDDWFVAFWLGDRGTFSVISHEGWHQYVARNCKGRLPPALEEGFACRFENLRFEDGRPAWDTFTSVVRSRTLAQAMAEKRLWSIGELLRKHAGDVIRLPAREIETFYAESWALSLFLMDRYPLQMQQYFADLTSGTAWRPAAFSSLKANQWNPNLSQPQLEHYLQLPLSSLDTPFAEYCRKLARRRQ